MNGGTSTRRETRDARLNMSVASTVRRPRVESEIGRCDFDIRTPVLR